MGLRNIKRLGAALTVAILTGVAMLSLAVPADAATTQRIRDVHSRIR